MRLQLTAYNNKLHPHHYTKTSYSEVGEDHLIGSLVDEVPALQLRQYFLQELPVEDKKADIRKLSDLFIGVAVELLNVDASLAAVFDDLFFQGFFDAFEEVSFDDEELLLLFCVFCHDFGGDEADAA